MLSFDSAGSLKQEFKGRHVATLGQIILILSKKNLIVIRNAVWLVEKQHMPIILVFGLTPPVLTTHGLPLSHRPYLLLQHRCS